MRRAGIIVNEISRFHAKIVTVDRNVLYIGGINVLSHGKYRPDCMLKIQDPDLIEVLLEKVKRHVL